MPENTTPEAIREVLAPVDDDPTAQLAALVEAIQLQQSDCPCSTCVGRTDKRTAYRKQPEVIARRKAAAAERREARRARALGTPQRDAEAATETAAEVGAILGEVVEVPVSAELQADRDALAAPVRKPRKQTAKQRATSMRKAELDGEARANA